MKLSIATILLLPAFASAFIVSQPHAFGTQLKAAATFEEDLEKTREVIAKFMDKSSKDEAPAEEEPAKKKNQEEEEE